MINENQILELIEAIATSHGIKDWQYKKQSFKNIAQNYFGILVPVSLNGVCNEKNCQLELVIKLAPTSEQYRVSGAVTAMFLKEIFVYSTLMPKYNEFQNNIKSLQFVIPKCYHICKEYCKEVIVLQNMCANDYVPFVENMVLDYNHIALSLKCLAQFHAMSYILKETDKNIYKDIEEICAPITIKTNKRFMEVLKDRLKKALHKFCNSEYVELIKNLEWQCEDLVEAISSNVNSLCVCHGDVWKENILFKYMDNLPLVACLIDYQTTRLSSPAYDVLFLIITSTSSQLRHRYYTELLEIYYKTFEQILIEAHLDVQELYSKTMFHEDLRTVAPACLIIANTAIWLSSGLQDEGHIRSKIHLKTDREKEEASTQYKSRIRDIIDDLTSYNYLENVI